MIEVLMVLAALMILAALMLPGFLWPRRTGRSPRIQCVNNLKQIGLAFRVWEEDNNDRYPMFVPQTNGGSMEFTTGANAWRHFQVMSNELSTPLVVFCPEESDPQRFHATNFTWFSNTNISFFVGVEARESTSQMLLSGDHNLTNGAAVKNGLLALTAGQPIGWTTEMHHKAGNIALSDGSVQQISSVGLQNAVASSGAMTNLLQMPVLGP